MRLPVCCCLLLLVAATRGQDDGGFDLSDAFGPDELKPTPKPQPGPDDKTDHLDGFDFGETGGGSNVPQKPTTKPPSGGNVVPPKKPTEKPRSDPNDFDLGDGLGGDDTHQPTVKPQPGHGGGGGGGGEFGDSDLMDPGMHHDNPDDHEAGPKGRALQPAHGESEQSEEGKQSMLAGIISTVAVAAVGAVSSFVAYQKKKLCFKGAASDDPENVNMDSHKGDQSEPQVQSSLLAK
ncbi:CD99 antigen-like protein 2 isoform 2-T2 [Anomaloglossus baeobatrachus]|uniref:CD99 antigen-like protein 2 isoform X2 n=1 Tax=Anomaloglossus baeobatrachus TaxID=238106 RepID=UPI003F4F7379